MHNLFYRIEDHLLAVEKPGRYVGGEYGIVRKQPVQKRLDIALSFPDLYEIGMSNQAIKYLYSYFNDEDSVCCERVFAPAPDLEKVLRDNDIPLFTLENYRPLCDFDIIAFTVAYELSATNILNILDLGKVPILRKDRTENDPVVIAGGPAITNPYPFADFIDFVYMGEAEEEFSTILSSLARAVQNGKPRSDICSILSEYRSIWYPGKNKKTVKSVWGDFPSKKKLNHLIVPNIQVIQDVGTVEIMRGCPNGCRFCHAGFFYRPCRERSIPDICDEVFQLFSAGGYREITLSSLSTGDFSWLAELVKKLNSVFSPHHVSFSLPSLRIDTFTLEILESLSEVRKSGITFAVETPESDWQASINKPVSENKVSEILADAKKHGWKSAKFYFMIGLPHHDHEKEADAIIRFVQKIARSAKIHIHLNIGTFIPKAHTPYQWSGQLDEMQALKEIMTLKNNLKSPNIKFGYHAPFTSCLEGIISRGDERVGDLILRAFRAGARLDAWEEYLNRDIWRDVLAETKWDIDEVIFKEKTPDQSLPWDDISVGAGTAFLKKENRLSAQHSLTAVCSDNCDHICGVCNDSLSVTRNLHAEIPAIHLDYAYPGTDQATRYIFKFGKTDTARYYSHKNLMTVFERGFQRSLLKVRFSEGYNPKPKMEFALPLALGIASDCEFLSVELFHIFCRDDLPGVISHLNKNLPEHIEILSVSGVENDGRKLPSLASALLSTKYCLSGPENIVNELFKSLNKESNADREIFRSPDNRLCLVFHNVLANVSIYKHLAEISGQDFRNSNILQIQRTAIILNEPYSFLGNR